MLKSPEKVAVSKQWCHALCAALLAFVTFAVLVGTAEAQNVRPPQDAVTSSGPPQIAPEQGGNYNIDMWSDLRRGAKGESSIPGKQAGILVDASGESWRALRNGPIPVYGVYVLAGMVGLLALFFLLRGRIRVEHGFSGQTIERFTSFERTAHWLLAASFIVLALTGLNVLYGRYVLIPVMGKEAFAALAAAGKWLHAYVAFAFMAGLIMTFLIWVWHNIPHPRDLVWLLRGGGLFGGGHPSAKKFNGGQKVLFWLVMLGGLIMSVTGLQLLYPYDLPIFAQLHSGLNAIGLDLPAQLTDNQEQQLAATWHGIVALGLVTVIIAHIYIGSIGMEGAFAAMGSGKVDLNWAREHHNLWVEEELAKGATEHGAPVRPAPAE